MLEPHRLVQADGGGVARPHLEENLAHASRATALEQMIHQLRDELTETKNSTQIPVAELQPIDASELENLESD